MPSSVWDKVDASVAQATEGNPFAPPWKTGLSDGKWRRMARLGDFAGLAIWVLGFLKLFVFDFDVYLANKLGSPWSYLVQFRFLVILLVVAIILLAHKKALFVVAYAAAFPLIVLLWKLPRFLIWLKSWNVILALTTVVTSLSSHFRRRFFIRAVEFTVVVVAIVTTTGPIAAGCAVLLSIALIYHYAQTIAAGIRASKFVGYQQKIVRTMTGRTRFESLQIDPELRSDEVERFNYEQLQKFSNSVSMGLLTVKVMSFYASLLQQYRRSHALIFLNVLSYLWLLFQSIALFTLINRCVFVAAPEQYAVTGSPSIIRFLFYSTTSLYGNTVSQITAAGDIALAIATIAAVYGPIFILSLGAQIVMTFRQSKDDAAFGSLITLVRSRERRLTNRLKVEYEMTPQEAYRRLRDLGVGAELFLAYLASKIPDDIDPGEEDADQP
ncbi:MULTISPECIES: hypothetical protein [Mycobacterium]|nr:MULTISPECIES: hypothetical protein [Mycobacterium]